MSRQCRVLMYHWFRRQGEASQSRSPQLEITPELFAEQMETLARSGWHTISLGQWLRGDKASDPKAIVLSFDDGTADFWDHARPVLQQHGFSATLFIVSGHVGGVSDWDLGLGEPARPLMDWTQLRELQDQGFEIGSHTDTHRPLTEIDDDEAARQLSSSRATLTEKLGRAPELLAYPRGFFDERHKRMAREAGYLGACAVILGWGDLRPGERYAIRRMTIKGSESMARFRLRLALTRTIGWKSEDGD